MNRYVQNLGINDRMAEFRCGDTSEMKSGVGGVVQSKMMRN